MNRTHSESNTKQRGKLSDTVRTKTSEVKFCFEVLPENCQWCRRGDAGRQAVSYARSHDWKCTVANSGMARRRYDEHRRWRWP